MSAPSCNPWVDQSLVRNAAQFASCQGEGALASAYQLQFATFLALVMSALERLAIKGVTGFSALQNYSNCDARLNANQAYTFTTTVSLPADTDPTTMQQIIEWQLAQALCNNAA